MRKRTKLLIVKIITLFIVLFSFLAYHYFHKKVCMETRYAFDFGSGAIKFKGVDFDVCSNKVVNVFGQFERHIKLVNCIYKSPDGIDSIDQKCITKAVVEFQNFEEDFNIKCTKDKCAGIATAWARKAANSDIVLNKLRALGVKVRVLSQEEEGIYAFYSIANSKVSEGVDINDIIVWDIGGGSFQITTLDKNGKLHVYHGSHGVETFESELRRVMNAPRSAEYPFFAGEKLEEALKYAYDQYGKPITEDKVIYEKVKNNPKVKVYSIGGPMTRGFKNQMGINPVFAASDMQEVAKGFANQSLEKMAWEVYPRLPTHYVASAQIAAILVHGIMEGAGFREAEIINNTLAEYVLYDRSLWKND